MTDIMWVGGRFTVGGPPKVGLLGLAVGCMAGWIAPAMVGREVGPPVFGTLSFFTAFLVQSSIVFVGFPVGLAK